MMQKQADITFDEQRLILSGDLNFLNVMPLYQKSLPYLHQCPELPFDFAEVKSSDSAGLALIIEWIKYAKRSNKQIHFSHLSQDLLSIATAAGIDQLIASS